MDKPISTVLIHNRLEPCRELQGALGDLSLDTHSAKSCSEATDLVAQYRPLLVFVDLPIWNQSFPEIVNMEIAAEQAFTIIIVGSLPDIEEYVSAIEHGAFNFIAPPFGHDALTLVVHAAAMDALERRKTMGRVSMSHGAR